MAENAVNTEQGVILEALNNKVDLNQLNTNNQGLSYVSGLGMPSDRYIDLTLGAAGTTYTAPAIGWVAIKKVSGGTDKYLNIYVRNSDATEDMYATAVWGLTSGNTLLAYVPIQKGRTFTVNYNATGATTFFKFIYAQGESEE